ncbi:MAG: protein kinase [Polyangiales bacterium]
MNKSNQPPKFRTSLTRESLDQAFVRAKVKARLLGMTPRARIDRFELTRRLGRGGEGTVYEARDTRGDARVALKQLHPSYSAAGASLKREFRALADLVHPNLVVLHELFHVNAQWFYTMELVEGVDFVRYVRAQPAPSLHDALRAATAQLLLGLSALHAAGMIHRDLKPSNVLVRADGRVAILDYGLVVDRASLRDDDEVARSTAGTPAYAAPEQVSGRVEQASDLYAIGVMLYQALTGELPFEGSASTLLARKRSDTPLPPAALGDDVPADLSALCTALLAQDPAARPTAAEALAACGGGAAAVPVEARRDQAESFVGRSAQLAELHALANTRGATPLVVLLRGESGIGKSALLRRFCAERAATGAVILHGRCYEREHLPYKALDAIVETLVQQLTALPDAAALALPTSQRDALVRLFPAFARLKLGVADEPARLPSSDATAQRQRAFDAVRTLFQELARRRDVVFAVDDLQWGDLDSVALLQHLLGGSDAPSLLVLGVYRAEEQQTSPVMHALVRSDALSGASLRRVELPVGPLSSDEASELLGALAPSNGALSLQQREACVTQASGMPFALQQLAEHAHDAEVAGQAEARLGDVVRLRAQRCSGPARQLLRVLCVAGRPLETRIALHSAGRAGWSEANELCGRKLARWRETEHERCLEPYHDLVRGAVSESLAPDETRAVHGDIVTALEQLAADRPEHMIEHLLGAGQHARAGRTAVLAAERAEAQLAWNQAAALLGIARRTLDDAALEELGVLEKLALALASAMRHREAANAFLDAGAAAPDTRERRRLESVAVQQLMRAGDRHAGTALLRRLLREVGYRLPHGNLASLALWGFTRTRGRLDEWLARDPGDAPRSAASEDRMQVLMGAQSEVWVTDPIHGSVLHSWALREARKARDHHLLHLLTREAAFLSARHGPKHAARIDRVMREADALLPLAATPLERGVSQLAHAMVALQTHWQPRLSMTLGEQADAVFARECPGSEFERGWLWTLRGYALEMLGEYDALLEDMAEHLRHAASQDDGYSRDSLLMTIPFVHLLKGDADAAVDFTYANWQLPRGIYTVVDFSALVRLSSALLYRGDVEQAHQVLVDAWMGLVRSGMMMVHLVGESLQWHRARNAIALYWKTGRRGLRRDAIKRLGNWKVYPPVLRAAYETLIASIALADGDEDACRASLRTCIEAAAGAGAGAGEWSARLRLAQLDDDAAGLAAAEAWFRARGVQEPARWVELGIPGAFTVSDRAARRARIAARSQGGG